MFEWSDEYAIGNEMIDAEHQVFFGLIRAFHEALSDETDNTRLSRLLAEVSLYAKFHFRSEENRRSSISSGTGSRLMPFRHAC